MDLKDAVASLNGKKKGEVKPELLAQCSERLQKAVAELDTEAARDIAKLPAWFIEEELGKAWPAQKGANDQNKMNFLKALNNTKTDKDDKTAILCLMGAIASVDPQSAAHILYLCDNLRKQASEKQKGAGNLAKKILPRAYCAQLIRNLLKQDASPLSEILYYTPDDSDQAGNERKCVAARQIFEAFFAEKPASHIHEKEVKQQDILEGLRDASLLLEVVREYPDCVERALAVLPQSMVAQREAIMKVAQEAGYKSKGSHSDMPASTEGTSKLAGPEKDHSSEKTPPSVNGKAASQPTFAPPGAARKEARPASVADTAGGNDLATILKQTARRLEMLEDAYREQGRQNRELARQNSVTAKILEGIMPRLEGIAKLVELSLGTPKLIQDNEKLQKERMLAEHKKDELEREKQELIASLDKVRAELAAEQKRCEFLEEDLQSANREKAALASKHSQAMNIAGEKIEIASEKATGSLKKQIREDLKVEYDNMLRLTDREEHKTAKVMIGNIFKILKRFGIDYEE